MAVFNKFVRYLTRIHDERNARQHSLEQDATGKVKLSQPEQIPSVMLAFNAIETKTNEEAIIRLLTKIFQKSSNVKTQYSSAGETLLFAACKKGHCKVIRYLIENGLNCRQVTPLGTAMHSLFEALTNKRLSFQEFINLTRLLQDRGCDINEINFRKMTPFLCAVELGEVEAMLLYAKLDCDINKHGVSSYHALHFACMKYRPDILQILISLNGINLSPVSDDGSTPLYTAVKEWSERCSKGTCFESTHFSVRFKEQMQVLAMVEKLLLIGADPYMISTKKKLNLPSILLQVRRGETSRGRWCKKCQQNGYKHQSLTASLEHNCLHQYIGCPCKLTLLYTGGEESRVESDSDNEDINPPGGDSSGSGEPSNNLCCDNSAVPLTSQMLATCLLYGHTHSNEETDTARTNFLQKSSKLDIEDPYLQFLIKHFLNQTPRTEVLSLKVISRSSVRIHLASNATLQCMEDLPLPKLLLDYVSVKTVV